MLDKFKKLLSVAVEAQPEAQAAAAAAVEVSMDAEFSVMREQLAAAVEGLAGMTANFEAAQAVVNALTAEKAESAVKAEAAKYTARKEKVVLAIGTAKADGLMLATQGLDDVSFDAVVSALAGSVDVEASKGLFAEVGVSASADTTKIDEESSVMKLIKQQNKRAK